MTSVRATALVLLAPACMAPDPLAGRLDVEVDGLAAASFRSIPDGSLELFARLGGGDEPRLDVDGVDGGLDVRATGFPAIDVEAGEIAIPLAFHLQLSMMPGTLDMAWLSTGGGTVGDRGVQVIAVDDEIVARIAGVRVLERHGYSDEAWGHMVHRVYADRETGTVLVVMVHCAGDSCTCDPKFTATTTRWSPETFTEVDRRACDGDVVTAEGQSACDFRPLPFEEPVEPWNL